MLALPSRFLCLKCNCAFIFPLPDELPRYDTKYNLEFVKESERYKAQAMAQWIIIWTNRQDKDANIIEIGPGNGWTLAELKRAGYNCKGLEQDWAWAAVLTDTIGVPVEGMGIEQYKCKVPFDIIYSSHVIEHVRDPLDFLRNCLRLLATGGRILIDTPDIDAPRHLDETWHHFNTRTPYEHICCLSKMSLGVAAAKTGLKMVYFKRTSQYASFRAVLVKE